MTLNVSVDYTQTLPWPPLTRRTPADDRNVALTTPPGPRRVAPVAAQLAPAPLGWEPSARRREQAAASHAAALSTALTIDQKMPPARHLERGMASRSPRTCAMALSGAHDLRQHMERRLRQRSACGARFRGCAATRRVLPRLCAVCRRGATETWARGGRGSSSQRRRTHVAPSASNELDDQTAFGRVAIVLDRHLAAHQVMMSAVRHAAGVGSARVSEGVERRARKEGEGGTYPATS